MLVKDKIMRNYSSDEFIFRVNELACNDDVLHSGLQMYRKNLVGKL